MPKKSKIIQVPMPEQLLASLDELSRKQDVSRSAVIREACAKYVTSNEEAEWDAQSEEGYAQFPEDDEGGWRDRNASEVWSKDKW